MLGNATRVANERSERSAATQRNSEEEKVEEESFFCGGRSLCWVIQSAKSSQRDWEDKVVRSGDVPLRPNRLGG